MQTYLPGGHLAVRTRIAAASQHSILFAPNYLTPAETEISDCSVSHVMSHTHQCLCDMPRKLPLNINRPASCPPKSWSIESGLRVHLKIDGVRNQHYVALRLNETAHHSEWPDRLPILCQKSRDDGMIRFLTGFQTVIMLGVERETKASVMQGYARARNDHS